METKLETKIIATWLNRKPSALAFPLTLWFSLFLFASCFFYFGDFFGSDAWMPASGEAVFQGKEYWRLFTTLFAHGDLGHLLANALLFIPLTYALASHFGYLPLAGVFAGALTNWLVLKTMPPEISLIGISGVVYWMGATWLTLSLLLDRRERLPRRFGGALFLTLVLFVPETLKPEVSHLSHFLGYVLGVGTGAIYYLLHRKRFLAAEVREPLRALEPELELIWEENFDEKKPGDISPRASCG